MHFIFCTVITKIANYLTGKINGGKSLSSIKKNAGFVDIIHVSNEKIGRDIQEKTAFERKDSLILTLRCINIEILGPKLFFIFQPNVQSQLMYNGV